tara:strand:- start:3593 stop:4444 length:852 start_codon:yes stop_codon:yes gene_type:complete
VLTDFLGMGQRGRNPNPFAPPPVYTTPGIGDDLPGATPMGQTTGMRPGMFGNPRSAAMVHGQSPETGAGFGQAPISLMPPDIMPEQANALPGVSAMPGIAPNKPGFFDKGGGWRDALGILGDALAGAAGQMPVYTHMKLQQRKADIEAQRRAQEEKARRSADRDTWLWQQQWKQQHPDDQFTQYMVAGGIDPHSPQGQALYKQRAEGMAAPPLMAVDGFDAQGNPTKTFMPRPTFAPPVQPPSTGPTVGMTRNGYRFKGGNPNDRSNWEPVGGAPPVGGATFR